MRILKRSPQSRHAHEVPAEIYISVVDSLYTDSRTLAVGSIAVLVGILLTALKTGDAFIYLCAFILAVVACLRMWGVRAYKRQRSAITTAEDAHRWELRYATGVSAHMATLGAWCVIAFLTNDPFAQLTSVASTIASLIGVAGRNFGSGRLVILQIVCVAPFMMLAYLIPGDIYYVLAGIFLLAFFASVKAISDRLRKTLLDAVIATRDVTFLASRFDAALNNMPLGLCMFDSTQCMAVANRRLAELFGVSPEIAHRGVSVREFLRSCVDAGTIEPPVADRVAAAFEMSLVGDADGGLTIETKRGRTLAITFQRMADGGSVVLFEDVTERKIAEAKIHHLARYDALTGLPNRTFFHDQIELALTKLKRGKDSCAILFIDLDQFKQVNDTMGHPFGDELLCAVADRLRGIVRESDIVARFGGDEFVILQSPVRRPEEAAALARRVVEVIGETFEIDGHHVVIGASMGISVAPQDGLDADLLMKNADMALYRTKSEGRGSWRFFEREMDVKAQARRNLEQDLRDALANDSFEVFYQPLFNLKTKRISSCEALLRWSHPERGMISPADFIPVAEEMGLIVEIGKRVLRKACAECMKWPESLRVAVNLSPIQARQGNVVNTIREALTASGLSANRLEIEITESVLIQDTEATRAWLNQLRELGVRVSLDDFGTGYSSLSYLHSFPLDKVKIDRSFLRNLGASERSQTLLHGVALLSAQLGLAVAVEGVETEEELSIIAREPSIDEVQGYLFSPAIPSRAIRKLLYSTHAQFEKVA